jgi:hypothetical protein
LAGSHRPDDVLKERNVVNDLCRLVSETMTRFSCAHICSPQKRPYSALFHQGHRAIPRLKSTSEFGKPRKRQSITIIDRLLRACAACLGLLGLGRGRCRLGRVGRTHCAPRVGRTFVRDVAEGSLVGVLRGLFGPPFARESFPTLPPRISGRDRRHSARRRVRPATPAPQRREQCASYWRPSLRFTPHRRGKSIVHSYY